MNDTRRKPKNKNKLLPSETTNPQVGFVRSGRVSRGERDTETLKKIYKSMGVSSHYHYYLVPTPATLLCCLFGVRLGIVLCFGSEFRLLNSLTKFLKFPFLHFLVFWLGFICFSDFSSRCAKLGYGWSVGGCSVVGKGLWMAGLTRIRHSPKATIEDRCRILVTPLSD